MGFLIWENAITRDINSKGQESVDKEAAGLLVILLLLLLLCYSLGEILSYLILKMRMERTRLDNVMTGRPKHINDQKER